MFINKIDCVLKYVLVIVFGVQNMLCVLPPPKKLHRVVAGFYSFHPVYDSDVPAPIASTKNVIIKRPEQAHSSVHHHFHYKPIHHFEQTVDDYDYVIPPKFSLINAHQNKPHSRPHPPSPSAIPPPPHDQVHHSSEHEKKLMKLVKNAQIITGKTAGGHASVGTRRKPSRWEYSQYMHGISQLFHHYLSEARRLALYYGHKYNYSPDLLYWQIVDVMFD